MNKNHVHFLRGLFQRILIIKFFSHAIIVALQYNIIIIDVSLV